MHNTYAVMIRRQDSPPHEQGAFVQLRGVIVPTELGIHVGQNGDGISCSSACKNHVQTGSAASTSHTTYLRMILRQQSPSKFERLFEQHQRIIDPADVTV